MIESYPASRSRKPLVSVIVIFLNAERFIHEAIESVLAQTYDAWELLLVDDGSTDGSSDIVRGFASAYPHKARYLDHEGHQNRGMSASRNMGIEYARGEYIAFLDADDVWLPHKLAHQVNTLAAQPEAAMVYGPTQWWYSWTGNGEDNQRDFIHKLGVRPNTLIRPPELLVRFLPAEGISPCTCSVLIRTQAARQVGGFEESFRGMYEDQAFFAKLCLAAPVLVTDTCVARYRQHSTSESVAVVKAGQHQAARLLFLHWLERYLLYQRVEERAVWRALRKELLPFRHPRLFQLLTRAKKLARQTYGLSRNSTRSKVLPPGSSTVESSQPVEDL